MDYANKTKEKILHSALRLYNQMGVSNVSIRQIAKESGISHSNLIYHYPSHEDVILGLHEWLFRRATELNQEINQSEISLREFFLSTKKGFSIVYDFAFLFIDLPYLCGTYARIKKLIADIEKTRSDMYKSVIHELVNKELMRPEEFDREYDRLIHLIKIFSDHWLVSATIYDELSKEGKIEKYASLFMAHFYPYLTPKGKSEFIKIPNISTHDA